MGVTGISEIEDFGVWQMDSETMVGIVKLIVEEGADRLQITEEVKAILKRHKIKRCTVHTEKVKDGFRVSTTPVKSIHENVT